MLNKIKYFFIFSILGILSLIIYLNMIDCFFSRRVLVTESDNILWQNTCVQEQGFFSEYLAHNNLLLCKKKTLVDKYFILKGFRKIVNLRIHDWSQFISFRSNETSDGILTDDLVYPLLLGKYLLANYYKEKYAIEILVVRSRKELLSVIETLRGLPGDIKVGLVVSLNYKALHETPVLYFKDHTGSAVYISDPINLYVYPEFTSQLLSLADLKVYFTQHKVLRQVDKWSCANSAFVYLKDALRVYNFKEVIHKRSKKTDLENLFIYSDPEELLKTVQNKQYLLDSNISLDTALATAKGQILRLKLDKHRRDVAVVGGGTRNISAYLLDKGYRYAAIIAAESQAYKKAELEQIYKERSGRDLSRFVLNKEKEDISSIKPELLRAAYLGHTNKLLLLLTENKKLINLATIKDLNGEDLLSLAVRGGHVGTFKYLLRNNTSFDEAHALLVADLMLAILASKENKNTFDLENIKRYHKILMDYKNIVVMRSIDYKIMQLIQAVKLS